MRIRLAANSDENAMLGSVALGSFLRFLLLVAQTARICGQTP